MLPRPRPLLFLLLVLLVACSREPTHLRIGVVMGGGGIEAARLALADANADARHTGIRLVLELVAIEQSSPSQPLRAMAAADDLAADPAVLAVLGHGNSAASIAAAQVYNGRGLPQLAPSSTAPLFTQAGEYSFRMVPDDTHQAHALAAVLAADSLRPRVALVYVNDDYGRALWKALRSELAATRVQVVYETPIVEGWGSGQMELVARSVGDARPLVVCWLARAEDLRSFSTQLRLQNRRLPILGSDAVDHPLLYGPARHELAGLRFIRFVDTDHPTPAVRAFRARYRAARHEEPTDDAVLTYDGTRLLAQAILSGAHSRRQVRDYLATIGQRRPAYAGVAGSLAFDRAGNAIRRYHLTQLDTSGTLHGLGVL